MTTIAVIHPSSELYGADRIMVNALQALPNEIKKVVYLRTGGPLIPYLMEQVENVHVEICTDLPIIYRALFTSSGIFKLLKNFIYFQKRIKKDHQRYKFASAYVNTLSSVFALAIFKKLGVVSFIHVHEIIERPKFIAKLTAKIACKNADSVVCVSNAVYSNLLKYSPELSKKATIIYNGIKPISSNGEPQIGSRVNIYLFGRLMPKKGQWYLVDALKTIPKEKLVNTRFYLVGDTLQGSEHLKTELIQYISKADLQDIIEIKGFKNDISTLIGSADICLVPSLMKDPFPTTVLEAMSVGKPVIATNHGGAAEAINDPVSGILIAPDAPASFAASLLFLIKNSEERKIVGDNAKIVFNDRFTLEIFKKNWLEFNLMNNYI